MSPFLKDLGHICYPRSTLRLCKGCHAVIAAFCSPALGVGTWGCGWGNAPHCSSQVKLHTGEVCEPGRWVSVPYVVGPDVDTPGRWVQDSRVGQHQHKNELWRDGSDFIFSSKSRVLGLSAAFSQSVCIWVSSKRMHCSFVSCPSFPRRKWAFCWACSSKLDNVFFLNNENN